MSRIFARASVLVLLCAVFLGWSVPDASAQVCSGAIGDFVWFDTNGNGIQNPGEPGINGVTLELRNSSGALVSTAVSGARVGSIPGSYQFFPLCPDTYTVTVVASTVPAGYVPTLVEAGTNRAVDSNASPATATIFPAPATGGPMTKDPTIDFGFVVGCTGSIGNFVWNDLNQNGLQDPGEPGVAGVILHLFRDGVLVADTDTDSSGFYLFRGLCAGNYAVTIEPPSGTTLTTPLVGTDRTIDSNGSGDTFALAANENNLTIDFGIYRPCTGSIGDRVWFDANRNGIQDDGELGIAGVTVRLLGAGGVEVASTVTGANGDYLFSGLCGTDYTVVVDGDTLPPGVVPTVVGAGTPQTDSNGSPAAVTIPVNGSDLTIDFGYYTPCSGSIGDFVWHDQNNNGVQDSGEPGIAGVHVTLRNAATHEILGVDITDASGGYLFEGLCGGSFIVEIDPTTLPDGMVESAAFQGGSTEADSNGVNFQASVTLPDDYSSDITIDFGYHLNKPLKATKTAAGSYTRQYEWQLTKTVNPDSYSGQAGQVLGTSTWSVTATQSQSTSGFSVVGEITIENANTFPVDFSVADQLSDGTAASVTCPSTTVPANGSLTCSYLASPAGATATLNTATITSLTEGVAGATATAPVTFAETVVGDAAVTLGDTRFSYSQLTTGTSAVTFDETFSCPSDPSVYVDGLYTSTVVNTATLTGASTDLTASAQVGLRCTLPRLALQATKTAAGSYRRTVSWGLTKTVNPSSYSGQAGAFLGTSTWSVTAVKSVSLGNYQVTGSISVFNPNSYPVSFSVSDVMNDGTAASVTCPTTTAGAGATVVCSYTASPAGATATLNTATITSLTSGVPGATATAAVAFAATTVGDDTVTLGDARFSYSQSISASSAPTFPENFSCPADTGQYVNGSYSFSVVNTATLLGASTNLSASATVNVTCRSQQWATGTATGAGIQWPGTNNWFMYTPYTTAKVNLIYGQFYDAGDIYMSRTGSGSSTRTIIRITLHAGYRWASVAEVLKIQPMRNAPTTYLEPGQFQYKFTAPNISNLSGATVSFGTDGSVIVSIPGSWNYLGIHGSVQRLVN